MDEEPVDENVRNSERRNSFVELVWWRKCKGTVAARIAGNRSVREG